MTKGKRGAERLKTYYAAPGNTEARNKRAAETMETRRAEMTRKAKATLRGCDVPPELEAAWVGLKRKKLTNIEAARALGLPFKARKRKSRAPRGAAKKKG